MSQPRHPRQDGLAPRAQVAVWGRYGLAALLVAAASLLMFALYDFIGLERGSVPFIFFFGAVLLSARYGGRGPGLFSVALSALLAEYFFLPPFSSLTFDLSGVFQVGVFILIASLIVLLTDKSKRAEASTRESRESLSTTLRSIGDGVIATDERGRITLMNAVAERLTGWTEGEARGRDLGEVFRIVNEETGEAVESPVSKVLREGAATSLANHTILISKDGTQIPIGDSGAPVHDHEGRVKGVVMVFHDITQRRLGESALRESEGRFRSLAESASDAIITIDEESTIVFVNPAAEKIFGYGASEMTGQQLTMLMPDYLRHVHKAGLRRYLEEGRRHISWEGVELPGLHKDGREIPLEVSFAEFVKDGRRYFTGIARDISSRKHVEQRLAAQYAVTRILAEHATLDEATPRILQSICENLGWAVGGLWEVDRRENVLRCVDFWQASSLAVEEFVEFSRRTTFVRGAGLPGRVWESGTPAWITDVGGDENFLRAEVAKRAGLRSAFGFPVLLGGEVLGAFEFFNPEIREPDEDLLAMMSTIGSQVGQFIERKRAEAEIKASEERYRELFENANDIIYTSDLVGNFTSLNKAGERITGYTRDEAVKMNFAQIVVPEHLEAVKQMISRKLAGEQLTVYQTEIISKGGRRLALEVSSRLIYEAGVPVGVQGIARNVTERRRTEEALRESEESFRQLADAMPQIVWTARADGYHDYYNRRWFEYTGTTLEQSKGWGWQPVLHPDDVEHCLRVWSRAVVTGQGYEIEYRFRRVADGQFRWHLGRAVPMRDAAGNIVKWFGTSTDIHDQKVAAERSAFLAEAGKLLASSLDYEQTLGRLARLCAPVLGDHCLIDVLDDAGRVSRVAVAHVDSDTSDFMQALRDYPPDMKRDMGVARVLHTGQPEVVGHANEDMMRSMARDRAHLEILRRLGLKSFMTVPLVARERTVGALTFGSTASPRQYDAEDIAFAQEIANRAALAIDNTRLYRRTQEANRAKDEFLATLSHELRTPLTPIIGWTHMLQGGRLQESEFAHGLGVIESNAQSLTRLINDLLDMSSILSGKMSIELAPVELGEIIGEAVETIRPQAERRGVRLEVASTDGARAVVSGDRTRLVQVFWNLLSNAVKFSRAGGHVAIRCVCEGARARVEVSDEGAGIDPAFLPHVFERFRQADGSTTRAHGGLGIGLSLVKSFVEAHEGGVAVESEGVGRGSRFTVSLPLLRNAEVESRVEEPSDEQPAILNPQSSITKVLVVDDSRDTLEMLQVVFSARGYEAVLCETAAEALQAAATVWFDIIVSDIGLPQIDGYELIRRLRELPHLREAPAVAVTGYASTKDAEQALAAGFNLHVPKPVDTSALAEAVERLLEERAQKKS